jgi:hypothetical protein
MTASTIGGMERKRSTTMIKLNVVENMSFVEPVVAPTISMIVKAAILSMLLVGEIALIIGLALAR